MQAEGVDPAVLDMDPEKPYGAPMGNQANTQAAPAAAKPPAAKPPAAKAALPAPPAKQANGGGGARPPKPAAGRANLLADIAKRRID